MAYHESKSATYEHISSPAISPDESIAIHPIRQSAQSNPLTKKEISLLAKRFSGKLLLRQEIEMDELLFSHLVSIHAFRPVPSIITSWKGETCQRCGNQSKALFAAMPCRKCQKRCIYCRKCIEMGRVLACQPLYEWTSPTIHWPSIKDPCSWRGSLTAAQEYASNRLIQALHERGEMLVWAVCGAGKTEMLFPVITEALKQGKRICIATPRADVVRELKPRLLQAFPKVSIQALYGGSEDKTGTAQLIIATTHQLLRFKAAFDVMIIDEIDAFPYNKDASLPFASNRAKKTPSTTIYLTATPRKEHQLLIQKSSFRMCLCLSAITVTRFLFHN
ncbi:DEAD/DEAH box helicase family protein [Virgibacillus sp. 179-BFC.A HS]|uniref:DEAD/DEAH box helicase family protein n=1 Tax=Tigheibacillus jepli TaxID=3035914 RepID=A0ABU5CFH4_9BACI|nr:DEAD/DEAH box helicase family protein [Virgibacillus sp. 179-BFC.A HS]MDY0405081.1 DEAD/DEAH box helicase family protein [Virgibacillus sp. 179-BFC.A HS]